MKRRLLSLVGVAALAGLGGFALYSWLRPLPAPSNTAPASSSRTEHAPPTKAAQDLSASPSKSRSFSDLTPQERVVAAEEIMKYDVLQIYREWLEAGTARRDDTKQIIVGEFLAQRLRSKESGHVFSLMRDTLHDASSPAKLRADLVKVLALAATPPALELVVDAATSLPEKELRDAARQQLRFAASNRWDARFHEELAPLLDKLWYATTEPAMIMAAADAMARVGAPSSIEILVSHATLPDTANMRVGAARDALLEVRNPNSIPPLTARIVQMPSVSSQNEILLTALSRINTEAASRALLGWLQMADETAGPLARRIVAQSRTQERLDFWEIAVKSPVPFASNQNRDAITQGLDDYRRSVK